MKKVRDDIYQVMHGFKPLKRGERRKGQSEWYYLDPRYKDDDAQKEIDVLDGEAPNPRLGRILTDDMQKNPDDYYIWHTKGDDKVRARIKITVAPVVFTASGEVFLLEQESWKALAVKLENE